MRAVHPTIVERAKIVPPRSQLGPITPGAAEADMQFVDRRGPLRESRRSRIGLRETAAAGDANSSSRAAELRRRRAGIAARAGNGGSIHRQDFRARDRTARRSPRQPGNECGEKRRAFRRHADRPRDHARIDGRNSWRHGARAGVSSYRVHQNRRRVERPAIAQGYCYFFAGLASLLPALSLPLVLDLRSRSSCKCIGDLVADLQLRPFLWCWSSARSPSDRSLSCTAIMVSFTSKTGPVT